MSNKNNKELSQLLKYMATRDVIRIDMAFCDPITREWYKSDVRVLDLGNDFSEAIIHDNQIYSSAISAISDIYGVPINYLTQHHKDGHDIEYIYPFEADETHISGLIKHCERCCYKSIDIHVEGMLYESAKVAFLDKYDTFQQIESNNEEKFAYIQKIFAKYIFSNTELIKNIWIIPNVISFRGEEYLSSFCILSAINSNRFRSDVGWICNVLRENAYDELVQCLYNNSLKEATKSAKAAIMSRNMSHNLGSHVMFYIKQKLQSVSKIVGSNVLHNIIPGNLSDINEIQKKVEANTEIELPFLVGLGRFINYLQERQDYIATVATDYIPAKSAISFKDFIYDELKPDLRYKRHHPNGKTDDAGWQPRNLLLDYIAYSEGYRTSDDIVIRFGEFDGRNPIGTTANTDFQKLRKFNIAVPGGVIGRQAIFSIVENIIRNAAKHSEHRPDGKLVLEMSLVTAEDIEKWGKDFRCKRQENSNKESGAELARLYKEEKNKFHYLRIKVDMPNKSGDIESLVENLASPYIEEGGKMKESSKGLKEMRISAAWLRGYSIDTDIPQYEPPVLAVYSEKYGNDPKDNDQKKESLSYILCIPRPCRVAFVVEKEYDNAKGEQSSYINLNEALQPLGCVVFEYDNTKKKLSKNELDEKGEIKTYDVSEIADYELVCMLLGDNEKTKKVNNILPYISSRHITPKETTEKILDVLGEASDKKSAIDSIYEYWFEDKYPNEKKRLLIVDDNAYEKHQKQSEGNEEKVSSTIADVECLAVGTADEENCRDAVIYSTHFAGLYKENIGKKDDNKTKSGYEKLQLGYCIEPITGNNSTDRLIRQDEWTTEWKYKHLSAGLARVAVFDERIFGSFITSSNEEYTIERKDIFDTIKKHEETPMSEDDFVAAMKSIGLTEDDSYDILEDMSDQNINEILSRYSAIEYNGCVAQKNYERRIWAFNIQADECYPNTMNIMGYDAKIKANPDWADENIKKPPIKVATLTVDNGEYKVELSEDGKRIFPEDTSKIFDYITIHQGVLDKIYNVFDIKENIKKNIEEKHKVTNALHRCFSKCTTPEKAEGFLPNFIIHSGRSKPNEQDMPQHQPFVQFAAVDHAIKDCKYTLVELLATAHYEKGGNNN